MGGALRWCFTKNKAEEAWRPVFKVEVMLFLVWELEVAPSTGMKHIQGYVRFKMRVSMAQLKKHLCKEIHAEPAKGSEEENYNYCIKDRDKSSDWKEEGVYDPKQRSGRRTDLEDVSADIIGGMP